ncbi:MAG: efflux RND transporter permease subunit [Alphaproteobacteria bacterium]|nr:efflux RND transporter permease subunit [Alphaproteobacteria bacterium]
MQRWLPWLSVHRPVTVVMIFTALMVLGGIAWSRIPLEMMPGGFELNRLWVWVPYRDSTPQENENALVRPMEEQLATVEGLKTLESRASSGSAQFELEFHRSISMAAAYNATVDRMERAMAEVPDDVDRYWVYRWNPSDEPIVWAGMSFPEAVEDPYHLSNEVIARRLERVSGVGKVDVWGVDPKRVFIDIKLDALLTHGLSLGDIVRELGSDNFQLASGRIVDRGQVRYVRSLARWEDLETLEQYPVAPGVTLGDISDITYRLDPSADIAHINGDEGAALAINKESGANTVSAAAAVRDAITELEADPRLQGAGIFTFFDQGKLIQGSIDTLVNTALTGGLCAVVVLFAFLRDWRMTLLIAACIPVTLLFTVTILYFTGGSLNLLSLMGLMLAVGMVVDNAIVVVESIYARRQVGEDRKHAAVEGAAEVGLAITMSTLTTMVVFLPVILMTGDADFSFFLGQIGFPVVFALATSLLVALLFTPLTTTLLKGVPDPVTGRETVRPEPRWVSWLVDRYGRTLSWVLAHRTDSLVGVVGMLVITFVLPVQGVQCTPNADGNMNDFVVRYEVPGDYGYYERLDIVETFEDWVEEHREEWGVRVHRSRLGSSSGRGSTYVYLEEERPEGAMSREDVVEAAKASLPQIPGVDASIGWQNMGAGDNRSIRIVLRGEDTATLATLAEEATRRLRAAEGVLAVRDEMEEGGGREMRLVVDRDAASRAGVSAMSIGQTVGFALRGTQLPDYQDQSIGGGSKEVDVVTRFQYEDRQDIDRLLDFPMWSPVTQSITPLRALVDTEVAPGLGSINREDRITSWPLTIDLDQGVDMTAAWGSVDAALAGMEMPRGYRWDKGQSFDSQEEDNEAILLAVGLSVVFVFLIMGVLFESFLLPVAIITTVPMALFGAYWTLYLTGGSLDPMGGVGVVVLIGVVVNNGIVLIDLVTRLRDDGHDRTHALVEAGRRRLRPILMTALTTIFGLLPMAMGTATFIGIPYAPMGRVVAGGMVAGTLLTLFFLPYLYSVLDDMRDSAKRQVAWILRPRRPSSPQSPAEGK